MTARRAVRGPLLGAVLLAALLSAAGPVLAARIVLVSTDGQAEGFNDPRPASPVTGNQGTTLGEQRTRVFEAVAFRLGTMIASPVEIRVEAAWDPLECEATSGTLASAGPSFVFRDFSGAPRGSTWYAAALADALAGRELGSTDDNEMSITFNSDIGTAGCLTTRDWDYRIGVGRSSGFLMEKVLFHELGHGINFTTFVDSETGEKFQGMDDAYMIHLEDHSRSKTWNQLSNAQRRASATRTGELHWLGGNALAHAPRLLAGAHSSGHPQMYAPDPFEGGSSVSHWDVSLNRNVDDFMEPFATRSSADLLTGHLYQDLGWSVNRSAAGWVEDQNANGAVEVAVLRLPEGQGGHEVLLLDSGSGELVRRIPLPAAYAALDLAVVSHHSGPPASEIAVLLWRAAGKTVQVVQFDASTGEEVARTSYPSGSPMRLLAVADFDGTAADELLVVGLRGPNRPRGWIKDSMSGALLTRLRFARSERPVDVAVMDSFGGSNAPEIAVLLSVPKESRSEIQVRDADSAARLSRIALPGERVYQYLTALADFGGTVGSGELATVSLDTEDGRPRLLVVDGKSGAPLAVKTFNEPFVPIGLDTLPSFGGSMADELLLWTRRSRTLKPRAHVLDAGTMVNLGRASLPTKQVPRVIALLPNIGRSSAIDVVVVSSATRDRLERAFLFDGGGARIGTLVLP